MTEHKGLGDFMKLAKGGQRAEIAKKYYTEKAALNESQSGQTGGYLLPPELRLDLMKAVAERAIFRRLGLVVPMKERETQFPLPDPSGSGTSGVPGWFGNIQFQFESEGQSRAETAEPILRQVDLVANELTGYAVVSNPLLDDGGPGADAALRKLFADAIAWFEDWFFLNGTGAGQPLGIIKSPGVVNVSRGTASKVQWSDITTMFGNLPPISYLTAVWIVHPSVVPQITTLQSSGAQPAVASNDVFASQDSALGGMGSMLGRPVLVSDKVSTLGTPGDCILVDPARYIIGDRDDIDIQISRHVRFTNNQSVIRITKRVDGQPWYVKQIKLADNATSVSPYVILN